MNASATEVLVLKHAYKCPAEKLFSAWLDPETVRQFMAPDTSRVSKLDWTAKVGSDFLVEMTDADHVVPHTGRFLEIDRPRRIVFTWNSPYAGKDTQVTLDFAQTGDKTLLTLTHERLPTPLAIDQHRGGWNGIIEKLAAMFA